MRITVAVCAWNRARLLDQTLAAMRQLQVPAGVEWEFLVVNNNCIDATDNVIEPHSTHLPVRRIFEVKQELSHARSRAVAEATGELIVSTDDDVLVDPGWLASYVSVARQWLDAAFFGGPIAPWFEMDPPRWIERLLPSLYASYVIVDGLGDEVRPIPLGEKPIGANMAFRTDALKHFPFDLGLGKSAGKPTLWDDADVVNTDEGAGLFRGLGRGSQGQTLYPR